ncbi:heme utilization cystosolic carrier protein HutX [Alkalimarinus sediminis]|uniref:Heme utilization cystosolic carrier protein HutX n=1 Tax=Alkalimarinus sediminis TaxID=1632866 RepID=A0A9E8HHL3_9ALTE|nr:heme utilization cystosolic carrier protein HutX [Alkalimarinus sediminis]UZW74820.1 heme utilization cystosolic carrier protein HutX [Alkalimarinus sediminis]
MSDSTDASMPGDKAQQLLETISQWQNTTTIILHGGSVFEFKGVFPQGKLEHGFYNLKGENGFEGHLNLDKVKEIRFQSKLHRGQESHAFVFHDNDDECIFKIFLGRDAEGQLYPSQKQQYLAYQQQYMAFNKSSD